MSIIWSITQLNRELLDGLVTTAHWRCEAVEGDQSASTYGSVGFERGDIFVEYDNLTQAQVLEWVKAQLDAAEIEAGLQSHIYGLKNPVNATGVPWQQAASNNNLLLE
jgi:hypothetical protein